MGWFTNWQGRAAAWRDDFTKYFEYGLSQVEVISGDLYNIMRYEGEHIDSNKAYLLYNEARYKIWEAANDTDTPVIIEQLEIMRELKRTLKGLILIE